MEPTPRRRPLRLKNYDYSQAGYYFITICTQNKLCLFGKIKTNEMRLNNAGHMINKWWNELNHKYPNIELHDHIVMPNHIHGIIEIKPKPESASTPKSPPVGADLCLDPDGIHPPPIHAHTHNITPLPTIIQWFKTMTTNEYIRNVKYNGWPHFTKNLWQRTYYEHVIRNELSYTQISEYIQTNPSLWFDDTYYV